MPINFTTASTIPGGVEAVAVPVGADLDVPRAVRSIPSAGANGNWEEVAQALEQENAEAFLASTGFRGEIGQTQSVLAGGHHVVAVGTTPVSTNSVPSSSDRQSAPTNDDLRRAGAALGESDHAGPVPGHDAAHGGRRHGRRSAGRGRGDRLSRVPLPSITGQLRAAPRGRRSRRPGTIGGNGCPHGQGDGRGQLASETVGRPTGSGTLPPDLRRGRGRSRLRRRPRSRDLG